MNHATNNSNALDYFLAVCVAVGAMCMENTMNASRNIIVNLDGGRLLATTYGNMSPQQLADGQAGMNVVRCIQLSV